jgi:RNA recognition motif-containing protein
MSERSHSPNRSGIHADVVRQYTPRACPMPVPQYTTPGAYSWDTYPQGPPYSQYPTYPFSITTMQQASMYSANTSGIPVNVRHGAMLTEARGIFINNLNYQCTSIDLHALLCTVGRPIDFKLHKDRMGQPKGAATAKFATKEEANYAATHLNRAQHMGMTINARLDTDTTVVGQVQSPVIVNGSMIGRVCREDPRPL